MSHIVNGAISEEFAALMVTLAEAYPNIRYRENTGRMYALQLADIPIEVVARAMMAAVRESEFFPTVAAIRKQATPSIEDAALLAWSTLERAVIEVAGGSHGSVEFEDPALGHAVLRVFGGWPEFCAMAEGPELAIKRQAFLAAYRAARRAGHGVGPMRLPGRIEAMGQAPDGLTAATTLVSRVSFDGTIDRRPDVPALSAPPDLLALGDGS